MTASPFAPVTSERLPLLRSLVGRLMQERGVTPPPPQPRDRPSRQPRSSWRSRTGCSGGLSPKKA